MKFSNIAVLTSKSSWFVPYSRQFVKIINQKLRIHARLFYRHEDISSHYEVVFILSYFRLIEKVYLRRHRHNLVVHESDLPKGTGWAPLFWQVLAGKKKIPFVMFDASEKADAGKICLKEYLSLTGDELYPELRAAQAALTLRMGLLFLRDYPKLKWRDQKGRRTYYPKRTPEHSKLDVRKSIRSQFNLLRTVNNTDFPAFFYMKGQKYILHIHQALPAERIAGDDRSRKTSDERHLLSKPILRRRLV